MEELPKAIADNVDAIRQVGNFAAHPMKTQCSGLIVEVEPGEAEWLLDVLEILFDFYFVQPEEAARRREASNRKPKSIGKPPLRSKE